jgi:hypothetical protein
MITETIQRSRKNNSRASDIGNKTVLRRTAETDKRQATTYLVDSRIAFIWNGAGTNMGRGC